MTTQDSFDLVIVGSGSGNSLVTDDFADSRVAVIEEDVFGGTCLNVGCIPTKMFVYAAEVAQTVLDGHRYGVDARVDQVHWRSIRDRVFGRIDPIAAAGEQYRVTGPNTTAFLGRATFTGPKELRVQITRPGGEHEVGEVVTVRGDQIVLATGGRPVLPEVFADVPVHTSDTIMRLESLPESMVIVGGGFVAMEFAHIFSALGVKVTVVARSTPLLRDLDHEIAERFTTLAKQQWDLHTGVTVTAARTQPDGDDLELTLADGTRLTAPVVLVATGRRPNGDRLNLPAGGVDADLTGRILVDKYGRTSADGVWSLGDASSPYQLKHVANQEARVVAHNLAHPDDLRAFDHRAVPWAVFTHPQVASVGLTEAAARVAGHTVVTYLQDYGATAYGWAMEDTTGVIKLVGDVDTGLILGAHYLGPHASSMIQPVIAAMSFGQRPSEVARGQYWIHPALAEVTENALLGLADRLADAASGRG